jgi:large subunit ribosomal protein L4
MLFYSSADDISKNLIDATEQIPSFTVMPLYGLNCYSMMKHETLVLSRRTVDLLERRILEHIHKTGQKNKPYRYMDYKQKILAESEHEEDLVYPPFV